MYLSSFSAVHDGDAVVGVRDGKTRNFLKIRLQGLGEKLQQV